MNLSLKIAKVLSSLIKGESINSSSAKSKLIDELVAEDILWRKGKHHKTYLLRDKDALDNYLSNQLQINNLEKYILALENPTSTRSDFVKISTDSKKSKERVFKGFLVNSYFPIKAELNNNEFIINPAIGSYIFIYDFETFKIDNDITIVGVENSKNFRQIQEQSYLFKDLKPLFISRYPQNQNKDSIKWMQSVPNSYLHFGDFDIAGIGIYINEYKKYLGDRAQFFIPKDIENTIIENGNRDRYNKQEINFSITNINEGKLLKLTKIIQTEKKGLDQEFFINE